jgi:hypothetical protein
VNEERKRWPWLLVLLVVFGAGAFWYSQRAQAKPETPQRFLFRKQLPTWSAARDRSELAAAPYFESCLAAAQPWPGVATALEKIPPAWGSKTELRAATKELNEALHQASLDFWVDPQFFYGRPILTTYEILSRSTWRTDTASTEALHVRRLDTLNLGLGMLGHASGDHPAILRDRIEVMVMTRLSADVGNDVDRLVGKLWREQLGKLISPEGIAEAERRLAERDRLARAMENRLKGGEIRIPQPERLVFGDEYFDALEPYTSTRRRGGPLLISSDLRALQRADEALNDSVGLKALVQAIDLEAALVEAHEARHALEPEDLPTPALLQSLVGEDDLDFGKSAARELRAFLGELRDAEPPACLSVLALAEAARGRYADSTPHFFAAHALLATMAAREAPGGLSLAQVVEVTTELCALPDAELRKRANDAAITLYGAPLSAAKRDGP